VRINNSNPNPVIWRDFMRKWSIRLLIVSSFVILTVLLVNSINTKDTINYLKSKGFQADIFKQNPSRYAQSIFNGLVEVTSEAKDLDEMRIDINFKDWEKLRKFRNVAMSNGVISKNEKEYINASILYKGEKKKVNLRLKGDWTDHLLGDKWSFRIKVKKDEHINGIRKFSIQSPYTKGFQGKNLINKMLLEQGVIVPKYYYVNVVVNGNDIGVMALEEHFSKEMLESSRRRESVIIKFDESELWKSQLNKKQFNEDEKSAPIIAFGEGRIKKKKQLQLDLEASRGLLRGFLTGKLKANEVFDVKLIGGFLAIHDLWSDTHGLIWHNLRFYYNPITAKLEPISFDQSLSDVGDQYFHGKGFIEGIKKDPYITLAYLNTLNNMHDKLTNDTYYKEYVEMDNKNENLLRSEFFLKPPAFMTANTLKQRLQFLLNKYDHNTVISSPYKGNAGWTVDISNPSERQKYLLINNGERLYKNADVYIGEFYKYGLNDLGLDHAYHGYNELLNEKILRHEEIQDISNTIIPLVSSPDLSKFHKIVSAYYLDKTNQIEVLNYTPYHLNLTKVQFFYNDKKIKPYEVPVNLLIKPSRVNKDINTHIVDVSNARNLNNIKSITISVSLADYVYTIPVVPYSKILSKPIVPVSTIKDELQKHDFLSVDHSNHVISISKGVWNVSTPLIIPPGYKLKASDGVTLLFSEDSYLLSYGTIDFIASSNSPIVLSSKDPNKYWGGVAIYGNDSLPRSIFTNVLIKNTSSLKVDSWALHAGVFMYKVDAIMDSVSFVNNDTEDSLNFVRSTFEINNIEIIDAISDGLDSDFSKGSISNSVFRNIGFIGGGDALDFSGSDVMINSLNLYNIADKGLSVGEESRVEADEINLSNLSTGVAVKDGSYFKISNSRIVGASNAAVMAYTKKKVYGGSKVYINNTTYNNIKLDVKSENVKADFDSIISIDGSLISRQNLDVNKLYKTNMKKGLRL
jgi:hypothetical protein